MNLKKITSLTMLTSILMMSFTGIMLFVSPPGRVANWADWRLFGLSKEQYAEIHTTFMVLFLVATLLHIYYNWKPMISYMRNKARELVVFTGDMLVALLLTAVVLLGTLYEMSPFSDFVDFSTDVSDSWIDTYGEPPYGHAELSSIKLFAKKMGLDLTQAEASLKQSNIDYRDSGENLKDIAKRNGTSPQALFNLMQDGHKNASGHTGSYSGPVEKYTGLGKRKVADVAKVVGLSTEALIAKMKTIGIEAKADDRFKEVSERYNMSPSDIIEKLGL